MSTPKNRKAFTEDWFIIQKKTINKAIGIIVLLLVMAGGSYAVYEYIKRRPQEAPPEKAAIFANIEGSVSVKKKDETGFKSADRSMALNQGDTIQTGSGGTAIIVYEDGTKYTLRPGSTLIITENARNQKRVTNDLKGGNLSVKTNENSDQHIVRTPESKAVLGKNTDARVNNENNKTTVVVTDGLLTLLLGDGKEQTVNADQIAEVEKTDLKMTQLPPPPRLSKPESAKELSIDYKKPEVEFVWATVTNAQSYTLEVSSTIAFTEQSIKLRVKDLKETRYKWANPLGGPVFWRVQGITKNQIETKWSEPSTVRINIIGKPILIELTKQREIVPNLWELEGTTEPGVRLRINNTQVPVDSNGHFKKDLPLPRNQRQIVLEAFGPNGKSGKLVKSL